MRLRGRIKQWLHNHCPGFRGQFPYFGATVFFPAGMDAFSVVCQEGIYEAPILRILQYFVRPGTTLIDVGGNIGLMAVPVLMSVPASCAVSFEPSPNSLPYLRRTAAQGVFANRWRVVGKALSDRSGQAQFFIGEKGSSLFDGLRSEARVGATQAVTIPLGTLDAEWRLLGKPVVSVLKIDVEGAEGIVLNGAADLLAAMRPVVVVEWYADYLKGFETPPEAILDVASRHGYRIFTIPTLVPVQDGRDLRVQMLSCSNFLLVP